MIFRAGISRAARNASPMQSRRAWTFLSNHSHVVITLAKAPDSTIRGIADAVGITERAVANIISDLVDAGVLKRKRNGRRNAYEIDASVPLRHPVEGHHTVGDILHLAEL